MLGLFIPNEATPTQVLFFRLKSPMAVRIAVLISILGGLASWAQEADRPAFRVGIAVLGDGGFQPLKGKRVGLVTNPSGVDGEGVPTWKRFRESPAVNLVALYGPEHGVFGKVGAGKHVSGERHGEDKNNDGKITKDEETGIKVYSLYGKTRKPTPAMMEGVDVIAYDGAAAVEEEEEGGGIV